MSIKERRERQKQDLRRRILDAAQLIITSEGFDELSMRKLAAKIDYSPAAIYLHFRSREQIAQELCVAGFAQLYQALSQANGSGDVLIRFRAMAKAYVDFGMEHPETYRLIFMADSSYVKAAFEDRSPDNPGNQCLQLLLDIVDGLISSGLYVGPSSPIELVEVVWGALHGIVSLQLTCTAFQFSPIERLTELMTATLLDGLIVRNEHNRKEG